MKNHASASSRTISPSLSPSTFVALRMILATACLGGIASAARAQVSQIDIGVRATIVDKPLGKSNLVEAGKHGKIYGILAVHLIPEEQKMVKPVDAQKLKDIVCHELDTHGFHQVAKGQNPEILVTVQYGRSWLNNPYFGEAQTTPAAGSADAGNTAVQYLRAGDMKQYIRLNENGAEAKAQKAQFEKLCILVTAWEYPTDPKAKARQLWHTLMNVDDPDHRDLNAVAAEMLAAGAPYFDKEIKEEEVDVYKPLPDGRVNVGMPEVVESATPKSK